MADLRRVGLSLAALVLIGTMGCSRQEEALPPEIRPVRVIEVTEQSDATSVSLSGLVEAQSEVVLAFRAGGRLLERTVDIGDVIEPGQVIARLDPENEENSLRAAQAALTAANAQFTQARANFERQTDLMSRGFTTRDRLDEAEQLRRTTESNVVSARAQVELARTRLTDMVLVADASGTVIARGAEPGEVVAAGSMIVLVARDDGRDAVFDVPASMLATAPPEPVIEVALTLSPDVQATGRVREVAPRADAATGTFRVRVGLHDAPAQMRLGSTVTGTMRFSDTSGMRVPASALTRSDGTPAVWVVDPASLTVSLRQVEILRHGPSDVSIASGLRPGDIVVTAGVQSLRPGQQVKIPGGA